MYENDYMVMVCNNLEAYPTDSQPFFVAENDIKMFLDLIKHNDKAIILYPPEKYIKKPVVNGVILNEK
jgi:hypothetical protein